MTADVPRVALLTWCSPSSRYAGGAAIRRLLSRFPRERVRWCGFHPEQEPDAALPDYAAFPAAPVHWRLADTTVAQLAVDFFQAPRLAQRMWAWLKPFRPDVLWVVPEMWAVSVGAALARLSGLPVHATVHDAPDSAREAGLPSAYVPFYVRQLRRLLRTACSVDAVSDALIAHLRATGALGSGTASLVVPPSVEPAQVAAPPPAAPDTRELVIGLCGSFRVAPAQWLAFCDALGRLARPVRLVAFVRADDVPPGALPGNVTLDVQPYVEREADVIKALAAAPVWACYLGLWRDPARNLFGRTSLSSKLVTYAAAARPILVDAEADAAAWQLVDRHGAGERLSGTPADVAGTLQRLLDAPDTWLRMAEGAHRLATEAFDLDRNAEQLATALRETAGSGRMQAPRRSSEASLNPEP